jgi:hypothetical protein
LPATSFISPSPCGPATQDVEHATHKLIAATIHPSGDFSAAPGARTLIIQGHPNQARSQTTAGEPTVSHSPDPAHAGRPPWAVVAACLAAVYIVWGTTYLAIKITLDTMPPFSMGASRFLIAGMVM